MGVRHCLQGHRSAADLRLSKPRSQVLRVYSKPILIIDIMARSIWASKPWGIVFIAFPGFMLIHIIASLILPFQDWWVSLLPKIIATFPSSVAESIMIVGKLVVWYLTAFYLMVFLIPGFAFLLVLTQIFWTCEYGRSRGMPRQAYISFIKLCVCLLSLLLTVVLYSWFFPPLSSPDADAGSLGNPISFFVFNVFPTYFFVFLLFVATD